MSDDPKVVDFAEARRVRVAKLQRQKRDAARAKAREGWRVFFTKNGRVVLEIDFEIGGEEWEATIPIPPGKAREIGHELTRCASYAEDHLERAAGLVGLHWCRVDGTYESGDSVRAVVLGFVGDAVRVEPTRPEDSPRKYWRDGRYHDTPRHGWPRAGLYSLKTGAPVELEKGRRHWRVCERDLMWLRERAEEQRR